MLATETNAPCATDPPEMAQGMIEDIGVITDCEQRIYEYEIGK